MSFCAVKGSADHQHPRFLVKCPTFPWKISASSRFQVLLPAKPAWWVPVASLTPMASMGRWGRQLLLSLLGWFRILLVFPIYDMCHLNIFKMSLNLFSIICTFYCWFSGVWNNLWGFQWVKNHGDHLMEQECGPFSISHHHFSCFWPCFLYL